MGITGKREPTPEKIKEYLEAFEHIHSITNKTRFRRLSITQICSTFNIPKYYIESAIDLGYIVVRGEHKSREYRWASHGKGMEPIDVRKVIMNVPIHKSSNKKVKKETSKQVEKPIVEKTPVVKTKKSVNKQIDKILEEKKIVLLWGFYSYTRIKRICN